jgi:hypothetical protein
LRAKLELCGAGLINMESEFAVATDALVKEEPSFVAAMKERGGGDCGEQDQRLKTYICFSCDNS